MDNISNIWSNFDTEIVSFLLAATLAICAYYLRPKVKLIWGQANKSWHSVPVETGDVNVVNEKHFAQNFGRIPANNVEIAYTAKPTKLMVFPQRDYQINTNPDGAHIVTIPYISPKELITLDAIYIGMNPGQVLSVKCKEQEGKHVLFWVVRKFSSKVYYTLWALMILGVAFLMNLLIIVITS